MRATPKLSRRGIQNNAPLAFLRWPSKFPRSAPSLPSSNGRTGCGSRLLDPDVHWTTAIEENFHGSAAVIERLKRDPPPAPPAYDEVRDGRIVPWIDIPGYAPEGGQPAPVMAIAVAGTTVSTMPVVTS